MDQLARRGAGTQGDSDITRSTVAAASSNELIEGEELTHGFLVGDYRIREMIGRGGCGTVYAAEHRLQGMAVAVKVLRLSLARSPQQVRRFLREARALERIDHPGIVKLLDDGYLDDGRPYFVMELIAGNSLAALISERGRFSPAEALEILAPICEPLALAHEAGIIHRDIKASNIMVTFAGGRWLAKLLDFGLAKLIDEEEGGSMLTSMNVVLGTLHSMAPEQILGGTVDARTDIYALGALLHRLLTGRHPFEDADGQKIVRMHLQSPPPQPSLLAPVSPALDAVVRRAMDKDPNRRFDRVTAFVEALREAVGRKAEKERLSGEAVGIYVEGRVAGSAAMDDAVLADLMSILDIAEQVLQRAGWQVLVQTTTALLAVLVTGQGTEAVDAGVDGIWERALAAARELGAELARRSMIDTRVHINLCIHRDRALIRASAGRLRVVGGAIADVGVWAPRHDIDGPCATREALGTAGEDAQFIPVLQGQ